MPKPGKQAVSDRALGRALLARQGLLAESRLAVPTALTRFGGLQAQDPSTPAVALAARLGSGAIDALSRAFERRTAVRLPLFRGTLHVVAASDAVFLRPLVQPADDRFFRSGPYRASFAGLDLDRYEKTARALLAEGPRHSDDLAAALAKAFRGRDGKHLAYGVRFRLPVAQLPPQPTYALLDAWLGRPLDPPDPGRLVRWYLAAFGPASVADLQAFAGLTKLGTVVDGLRDALVTFTGEDGRTLFDLEDAPRPPADTPAPTVALGGFDAIFLAYADHGRLTTTADRKRAMTANGLLHRTVLVDGRLRALWKPETSKGGTRVVIEALGTLGAREKREVAAAVELRATQDAEGPVTLEFGRFTG